MEQPLFRNLRIPLSTYRVQMNRNFRFTDAAEIVPYLKDLGITDLYTSPYFTARPGSLHGYDITDPSRLNPEIGSPEEYELLMNTLKQYEMGHVLDIVPNHMCIDHNNRYWMDLLENGPASTCSTFFDINWDPVKKRTARQDPASLSRRPVWNCTRKKRHTADFREWLVFHHCL
jgi:(1->4)-alpha-D-glucan 1-alpha-D-glucosylmutase